MKNNLKLNKRIRYFMLTVIVITLLGFTACSSRDAVMLETEDMVQSQEKDSPEEETFQELADQSITENSVLPKDGVAFPARLFVHICGAVCEPGVYELPEGSRVYEAVEKAGGFTATADENYVNLSLLLEDGWKIVIPTIEETDLMSTNDPSASSRQTAEYTKESLGITGTAFSSVQDQEASEKNGKIDINSASSEELCTLPGIGESRAESMIAYREKNGGFSRIEDIMKIEGIKEGMFSKLKDRICVRQDG